MADDIQKTIYKLEIDESGYVRGVEGMSESTKRLVEVQRESNKQLQTNEAALKVSAEQIAKAKKDLDSYTGSNEAYRKQLEKTFADAQRDNAKLVTVVAESRKAYEAATKAAQDFAVSSQRANNLQPAPGARIPTQIPLGIQSNVVSDLTNIIKTGDLSGLPEVLAESAAQFETLRAAITAAEERMKLLNVADQEFIALQEFVGAGNDAIAAYDAAVKLAAESTTELAARVKEAQLEIERISTVTPKELPAEVAKSKIQFDELEVSIAGAEARLKTLDAGSDEFKQLAPVIERGRAALEAYNATTVKTGQSTLSLRAQIRLGRDELVRMEEAGQGLTQEYIELEKRVASLTNAFGDQQDRIKVLASDTRALDFGKAAIQSATSAFQVFTSVSILAGGASEKLQKQTLQLFAAMQLLTSLEQLANTVKRGGILITNLQAASQAVYTFAISASTAALRTFRTALISTGIGAAVVGIGLLINRLSESRDELDQAAESQKRLNDVMGEAKNSYVQAVQQVNNLKVAFEQARLGIISKEAAVKLYNETIGKTTGFVNSLDQAEQALSRNADAFIEFTLLKAAAQIAGAKAAEKLIDATIKQRSTIGQDFGDDPQGRKRAGAGAEASTEARKLRDASEEFLGIQKDFQDRANALALKFKFNPLGNEPIEVKTVENVFAAKLKELQERLATVTAKSFESEGTIRKQFAASLEKEILGLNDLLKDKKITKEQAQILIELTARINDVQLQEALKVFTKKVTDARQKIQDDLDALQSKVSLDAINLIQDEFDRRAALIEANEAKELADAEEANRKRIEALSLQRALIGEKAYWDAVAVIIEEGQLNVENILARGAAARQDLSQDMFDKLLSDLGSSLDERDVQAAERLAEQIQNERDLFDAGLISRKQFEDNVSKITKAAVDYRSFLHRQELQLQLDAINVAIEATDDPKVLENLKKRQREIRDALAQANTAAATSTTDDPATNAAARVNEYAQAIGGLVDSIVSFWQKANEAEAAALDRSISIQERRVEAATRIAERGNAQYLKAETDRLKELQVARENAARRELAINAALQASQLLVGITGAITKIATPGVGTAEVIGAIAVIFAALATGYGLVKSLQGNQPRLKEGTTYVERGRAPRGTDTVQAWLSEGEAVIPERTNRAYHPTVEAIYDGTVPPEYLNKVVKNYVNNVTVKPIPQVNYERIGKAAEVKITQDSRLAGILSEHSTLLKENNELQRKILKKNVVVEQRMDRNGIAQSVTEYIDQQRKDSRS